MKSQADRTQMETGDQQSERVGRSREPQLSYDSEGNRIQANDLASGSMKEQDAIVEAQSRATGNRRDQPQEPISEIPR